MIATDRLYKAGRTYFRVIPVLGGCVLVWALADLFIYPPSPAWLALAGLTVLTGSFTVKIPGLVARLSVSEPFVFAAVLWFGPSVGAVTAALDALIMSLWLLPRLKTVHRVAFNVSVLVISIWVASLGFFELAGIDARAPKYDHLSDFVVPLYLFTACCFLLNSGLVAIALAFERKQSAFRIWREQFLWLSLNYFGGSSVAAVLVVYAKEMDWAVVGIIIPLLAISYLTFRTTLGRLDDANRHLSKVNQLYLSTIETLAMAVDAKDQVTSGHIRRVQRYALGLAQKLGIRDQMQIRAIEAAALLHDMGKLAIPEYILNKPGRLTILEFEKMKLHAGIGADILSAIEFPYPVIPIVRHHHENWDGSGYPDGLRGTTIPVGARILSVVDCYDALTSDRPYRPRLSVDDALQIIVGRRGSMYDPIVVDTFAANLHALENTLGDMTVESVTLRQIAELNSPSAITDLQNTRVAALSLPKGKNLDWLQGFNGASRVEDLAALALGHVAGRLPTTGSAIYIVDSNGATLSTASVAGLVPKEYLGTKTEFGKRISGWVAANRISALNSPATLDLDRASGTGGLVSSLVCPIESGDQLLGIAAFYSDRSNAFSDEDQFAAEHLASLMPGHLGSKAPDASVSPNFGFESGLASVLPEAKAAGRWPVGIVVSQFTTALESQHHQEVMRTLRASVRGEDSLVQIEANAFLLLLLRSDDTGTSHVASRLKDEFSSAGIEVDVEWASVGQEGASDTQAFTSLTEAIRRKTEKASRRSGRTTH
jgi:putative nucleotidyltransferase with HDIG domain